MAVPATDPDAHPFLTARHIDNLTEAVRNLSRLVAKQNEIDERSITATKAATETAKEQTKVMRELVMLLRGVNDNAASAVTPSGRRKG